MTLHQCWLDDPASLIFYSLIVQQQEIVTFSGLHCGKKCIELSYLGDELN